MVSELDGTRLKLVRAREQLNALSAEIGAFLGRKPYVSFIEIHDERREIAFGIEVREQSNPMLSVIIGEILHDLRSCLDHALWQLVIHDGGTPHNRTGFPIYLNEGGFDSESNRRRGMLEGLSTESIAEIKGLQPFKTGENALSPLWQLHELHNFDKHRTLILAAGQLRKVRASIGPLGAGVIPAQEVYFDLGPFAGNAIISRLSIPHWFVGTPEVQVDTPAEFAVVFGKGSPIAGATVVDTLARIGKRVYECIEQIDVLFS